MQICMRELSRADLVQINCWRNQPEAVDKLGSPFRYIDSEVDAAWFNNYLSNRACNVRLGACDANSGQLLGLVYLLNIDWGSRNGELSIWIPEQRNRGRGVGAFAVSSMLHHAFEDLNLHRVSLRVLADNDTAIGLYRKFGFAHEGLHREALFKDGSYRDILQMGILAPDFRGRVER